MGATGAIIMSFFGAVFACLTLWWQDRFAGWWLLPPILIFAVIAAFGVATLRSPGKGIEPSPREERAILWSTTAEGIGLFVVANVVINLHHTEWLLPAMAAVVGLHFLPIARAGAFTPFYLLGSALLLGSIVGFAIPASLGGSIAGFASAAALWTASIFAIVRDRRAKAVTAIGRAA